MTSTGSSVEGHLESTSQVGEPERRRGLTERGERSLSLAAKAVICLLVIGWTWSILSVHRQATRGQSSGDLSSAPASIVNAMTSARGPTAAFLTDATLNALANRLLAKARGISGKLRASIQPSPAPIRAESLPPGASLEYSQAGHTAAVPAASGIWNVILKVGNAIRPISSFNVITLLPFSAKVNGKVGLYFLGTWPSEMGVAGPAKAPPSAYANPAGFIEVTPANEDTQVSEHFKLRDFLTHDQPNVWPKYLVLQPRLVDKLELVLADLQQHGIDVRGVHVMSGFRTPQYNSTGGNTVGRANLSRHMYGDAADIYIDDDGDGQMDDLDHDGRITIGDSKVIEAAVDRVEAAHPELVGGAGVYTAAPGHGPFIHIDTRGYRARWSGTSGG